MLARYRSPVPAEVWTLAAVYAAGSVGCVLAILFPLSDQAPIELAAAVGLGSALTSAGLWLAGDRVPRAVLHAAAVTGVIVLSVLVASAKTGAGAMLTAFPYLWISVYIGHFFSRRAVRLYALLAAVGFGVALQVNGLPDTLAAWLIVSGTVWLAGDVLALLNQRLREQARTDPLTGTLNRHGLMDAAARELAGAVRAGEPLAVAVIDLDSFKEINDRDGHLAGDRLLAGLAAAWRTELRPRDTLARAGGDEFVLLLPATTRAGAAQVLDRLHDAFPAEWSAGVATSEPGDDLDACLARADHVLYEAKARRRARRTQHGARRRPAAARTA